MVVCGILQVVQVVRCRGVLLKLVIIIVVGQKVIGFYGPYVVRCWFLQTVDVVRNF